MDYTCNSHSKNNHLRAQNKVTVDFLQSDQFYGTLNLNAACIHGNRWIQEVSLTY